MVRLTQVPEQNRRLWFRESFWRGVLADNVDADTQTASAHYARALATARDKHDLLLESYAEGTRAPISLRPTGTPASLCSAVPTTCARPSAPGRRPQRQRSHSPRSFRPEQKPRGYAMRPLSLPVSSG